MSKQDKKIKSLLKDLETNRGNDAKRTTIVEELNSLNYYKSEEDMLNDFFNVEDK